eukprot:scaffold261594_cov21-Tisochrysis_lutea.AAC.1
MAAQAHAAMIADVQHGLQATWSPERLQVGAQGYRTHYLPYKTTSSVVAEGGSGRRVEATWLQMCSMGDYLSSCSKEMHAHCLKNDYRGLPVHFCCYKGAWWQGEQVQIQALWMLRKGPVHGFGGRVHEVDAAGPTGGLTYNHAGHRRFLWQIIDPCLGQHAIIRSGRQKASQIEADT